ncbi:MAG TPA: tRNA pseudouridine(13) synthase TruD [Salinisphaeraceae bacterium]|nr:tRNA pseudouridine(13) synthase TruD [Salinisphaeraceae bacterium]
MANNTVAKAPVAVDMALFAYARGSLPAARALIRCEPQDFQVVEHCPIEPSGAGEHLWLAVEKTNLTTHRVAQALAGAAQAAPRDVGFAGLKDRHAITRQWFSVPWPSSRGNAVLAAEALEVPPGANLRILEQRRHGRKLRRGAHSGNGFVLKLRGISGDHAEIEADLARIASDGVPNYFAAQRFGRDGRNLELAHILFSGLRLRREKRSLALSAARSFLFNVLLNARVQDGSWNRILPGEAVMLDGSRSLFSAANADAGQLQQRLAAFDVHPSGPLPGMPGGNVASGRALQLEQTVLAMHADLIDGLRAARVRAARRALRMPVRALTWQWQGDDCLQLVFRLPRGGYATSVLREIALVREPKSDSNGTKPRT